MSDIYSEEDVQKMIDILPKGFIEESILNKLNANKELTGWRKEDRELYEISKTFNDEFVKEILIHNEKEYKGYDKDSDEFPDESDAKIVESYKRLIKENITKEDERLIINIGGRLYTWRYAYKIENIDCAFIQQIYLYSVLEEFFDEAREQSEMYLSD